MGILIFFDRPQSRQNIITKYLIFLAMPKRYLHLSISFFFFFGLLIHRIIGGQDREENDILVQKVKSIYSQMECLRLFQH